jgi:hypothetical protein
MKRVGWLLVLAMGLSFAGGCATSHGLAFQRAAPCPGGVWMTARRGPTGVWSPGHWKCPD